LGLIATVFDVTALSISWASLMCVTDTNGAVGVIVVTSRAWAAFCALRIRTACFADCNTLNRAVFLALGALVVATAIALGGVANWIRIWAWTTLVSMDITSLTGSFVIVPIGTEMGLNGFAADIEVHTLAAATSIWTVTDVTLCLLAMTALAPTSFSFRCSNTCNGHNTNAKNGSDGLSTVGSLQSASDGTGLLVK